MSKLSEMLDLIAHPFATRVQPPKQPTKLVPYSLLTVEGVKAVQMRLTALGILDPPADGKWGGTSRWALRYLTDRSNVKINTDFDADQPLPGDVVRALQDARMPNILPSADFVGRVVLGMIKKGYWINCVPLCKNAVTVEGHDLNGKRNDNRNNVFNDVRMVFHIDAGGKPVLDFSAEATTEPSRRWTVNPMNPDGAFHIGLGQQKAWVLGDYHGRAFLQAEPIHGTRDPEKTFQRDARYPVFGNFGVHQHQGYNLPHDDMGGSSAGCQVIRLAAKQEKYVDVMLDDPRFKINHGYKFMHTVLAQGDVAP